MYTSYCYNYYRTFVFAGTIRIFVKKLIVPELTAEIRIARRHTIAHKNRLVMMSLQMVFLF